MIYILYMFIHIYTKLRPGGDVAFCNCTCLDSKQDPLTQQIRMNHERNARSFSGEPETLNATHKRDQGLHVTQTKFRT